MTTVQQRQLLIATSIGSALMLVGAAIGDWPYGYFTLLRWGVCTAAVLVGFLAYGWQRIWAVVAFGFVAILFNPLAPVHLARTIWQPIDIVAAVLFLVAIALVKAPAKA
ncbi:MAG: DUF6804 family protein [Chloroflexota bacterium]